MRIVKIADFKVHLSRYLRAVREGEHLVIHDRQTPIARVAPYQRSPQRLVTIPPSQSLRELGQLTVTRPRNLTPGAGDRALRRVRRDRFGRRAL